MFLFTQFSILVTVDGGIKMIQKIPQIDWRPDEKG